MRFASCMAPNAENFFIETVEYLADRLGIDALVAHDADWELRERDLDSGNIEIGWICGLPYVWKADLRSPGVELLAAPVMRAKRYGDQPVYFSDVMVRTNSKFKSFRELEGARWAYNEPRSHSGSNVVKAHLYDLGYKDGFFGSVSMAGSHETALQMILDGSVDSAAIDTTVYETMLRKVPSWENELRVIQTLGPSPMPPWVISTRVDPSRRRNYRRTLAEMHKDAHGVRILERYAVSRYELVGDAFYDPIRIMDRKAREVKPGPERHMG